MPNGNVSQILEQLKTLEPNDLLLVSHAIQKQLEASAEENNRAAFHQSLLSSGLVKRIKPKRSQPGPERRLIEVNGKPVSETIMEERR